jgi:hypothetical protein
MTDHLQPVTRPVTGADLPPGPETVTGAPYGDTCPDCGGPLDANRECPGWYDDSDDEDDDSWPCDDSDDEDDDSGVVLIDRRKPPRPWHSRTRRCLQCGVASDRATCCDAHKQAVRRKRATVRPLVAVLAQLLEGDAPADDEAPPRLWGLLRELLAAELGEQRQLPSASGWCPVCSQPAVGMYCEATRSACKQARHRGRRSHVWLVELVGRLVRGEIPADDEVPPQWYGLIRDMLQSERAKARANAKARTLPGYTRPLE